MILGIRIRTQMLNTRDDTRNGSDLCVLYSTSSVRMGWITCTGIRLHSVGATGTPGPLLNCSLFRSRSDQANGPLPFDSEVLVHLRSSPLTPHSPPTDIRPLIRLYLAASDFLLSISGPMDRFYNRVSRSADRIVEEGDR